MMGSSACAGVRSQLGVYLTGAIAPSDRARVVRHLTACKDCRAELAGLAALPALLRRPPSREAAEAPAADSGGDSAAEEATAGPGPGEALLSRTLRRTARRRRRRRRRLLLAAVALVLAAAAGAVWLLRPAGPPGIDRDDGTILRTTTIGGITVLTDGEGYTLYWFGRDTATKSACQASCTRRWPPVTGPAFEAIGVSGAVGEIARPDGSLQVTFDGHPLYTTTADTGPGQTRGDGVWSGGGQWHKAVMPRHRG